LVQTDPYYDIQRVHDPNADAFWASTVPLLREGVLRSFETKHDVEALPFGRDLLSSPVSGTFVEADCAGDVGITFGKRVWYSIGFSEYFRYLKETGIPTGRSPKLAG